MIVFNPYGPVQAPDFLLKYKFQYSADIDLVLSQPIKMAFLPAPEFQVPSAVIDPVLMPEHEKLKQLDLIFFSYTEHSSDIMEPWFRNLPYPNKLFSRGYMENNTDTIFYPWWFFYVHPVEPEYFLNDPEIKPYKFDAVLGCKRPPRDIIFKGLQDNDLIKKSIVTYRALNPERGGNYVCPHFQPEWDTGYLDEDLKGDGYGIFHKIYNMTDFSKVSETFWNRGRSAFFSEKTGRALMGKRLFVFFGIPGSLRALRDLGFQTFSDIIDESYDDIMDDTRRFEAAFQQVLALNQMDSLQIKQKIQSRVQHNYHRLFSLHTELNQAACDKIAEKIGDVEFWSKMPRNW